MQIEDEPACRHHKAVYQEGSQAGQAGGQGADVQDVGEEASGYRLGGQAG